MVAVTVITAVITLLSSQLNLSDGPLTTFSGGAGGFVTPWFLILGVGGIFRQLVPETGLTTKIARWLTQKLGARIVGLVILIYTLFIMLLGINGYIMVLVLYPITDNPLRENKMDHRLFPSMLLGGGASANGFMYTLDTCNVLSSGCLGMSLGSAPSLSLMFIVVVATCYSVYFSYAQAQSHKKHTNEELLAIYADSNKIMSDEELPSVGMPVFPSVIVLGIAVTTSSWGTSASILFSLTVGIPLIIATQFKHTESIKPSAKTGAGSGLNFMLTAVAVAGLSKMLSLSPALRGPQQAVLAMNMSVYLKAYFETAVLTNLTNSAISGETIFLGSFGQAFVDMGVDVQALHRIVAKSALILNKLPNSSITIPTMSTCGCSLRESYKHVVLGTVIPAVAAGLVIALMATFGVIF